ncbi:MAG: hypothetical protein OXB88_05260 [Bacteriovoracales bacterium]|nr:hypothetical protein [Bacteriovoracales bacterium]
MIQAAKIVSLAPHPKMHSLKTCRILGGVEETTVVCGAKNAVEGMISVLAEIGDTLPSGRSIEAVTFGEVESRGMLCSAVDLGISREGGIVDLPPHIELGTPLKKLPASFLSSIPWYSYKEVDALYWREKEGRISVIRHGERPPDDGVLISQTYFHGEEYLYRRYRNADIIF